ncbi:hypothetical protein V1509DRAFT_634204 [Lipomyces kononenkoae]
MFKSLFALGFIAGTALAQSAFIGIPVAGATLTSGANYTFQIQCPDSLTSSEQIAIVIGIQQCVGGQCASPDETMGAVLYNGLFDPQFHEAGLPPYQNFTVQMPDTVSTSTESALVGLAHFALVGDSNIPLIDFQNQSVTLIECL